MLKREDNIQEKLEHNLLEFIETWKSTYKIFFNFLICFYHTFLKERTEFCMFDKAIFWSRDGQISGPRSPKQNTFCTPAPNSLCVVSVPLSLISTF